jgi:hypothetical protein
LTSRSRPTLDSTYAEERSYADHHSISQPNLYDSGKYSTLVAESLSMERDPTFPTYSFNPSILNTTEQLEFSYCEGPDPIGRENRLAGVLGGSDLVPSKAQNDTFSYSVPTSEFGNPSGNSLSTQEVIPLIPDILYCDDCSRPFKGYWRKGNLVRHKDTQHGGEHRTNIAFPCEVEGCDRTYRRTDARLKHYRRRHRNLAMGPVQLRRKLDYAERRVITNT